MDNKLTLQESHQASHYEEKQHSLSPSPSSNADANHLTSHRRGSVDKAYEFLHEVDAESANSQEEVNPKALRRKIDKHMFPIMWALYLFHGLDKYLLGYAIVMGLPEDLNLQGEQMNNCVSAISWSYLAMTAIIPLALNKLPIGKWVGFNMICNGIFTACTAAVQGYSGLLTVRILMGFSDASITPCLMLLSSQYYRKDEQALRFAFWYSAIGFAVMLGATMSYGFQNVEHSSLASWRIMCLAIGVASFLTGLTAFLFLPDTPMNARFLSKVEKRTILRYVSVNGTGISNTRFELSQLISVVLDPQIWMLFLSITSIMSASAIISTYGTTMIRGFGYSSKEAALLNIPSGAIAWVSIVTALCLIRLKVLPRPAVIFIYLAITILGACLVAFMPRTNHAGPLAGLWLVQFGSCVLGIHYQWMAANVGGHTKRSISSVLMSAGVALGGIIGPYAMRPQDKPEYHLAKVIMVVGNAGTIGMATLLTVYYLFVNKRRDKLYGMASDMVTADDDSETWANLTDQERKSFRYVI